MGVHDVVHFEQMESIGVIAAPRIKALRCDRRPRRRRLELTRTIRQGRQSRSTRIRHARYLPYQDGRLPDNVIYDQLPRRDADRQFNVPYGAFGAAGAPPPAGLGSILAGVYGSASTSARAHTGAGGLTSSRPIHRLRRWRRSRCCASGDRSDGVRRNRRTWHRRAGGGVHARRRPRLRRAFQSARPRAKARAGWLRTTSGLPAARRDWLTGLVRINVNAEASIFEEAPVADRYA